MVGDLERLRVVDREVLIVLVVAGVIERLCHKGEGGGW